MAPVAQDVYKWVLMGPHYAWITTTPIFYDGDQLVLMGPDGPQWLFWLMTGNNWSRWVLFNKNDPCDSQYVPMVLYGS